MDYKPDKLEHHRTRVTVGGDRIHCDYNISAPTCALPTIKLLWNSVYPHRVQSILQWTYPTFIWSPLDKPEYMRMPMKIMPPEIVEKYNIKSKEDDGWVYLKIVKCMYGLPQAGKIENELLIKRLRRFG